jgi:1-deoxy-D-xylulose-5-phosphate synthase
VTIPLQLIGIPDEFIEHGSRNDCLVAAGLDPAGLARRIEPWWQALRGTPRRVAAQ